MHHGFITYVSVHYVRKKCLVPIAFQDYRTLEVTGLVKRPVKLSMHQLVNKSQSLEFSVTLVCVVNRRKEQNKVKQMIEVRYLERNISSYPHCSLHVLARRFCPLMSLYFGNVLVLVMSSAGAAREITKTHDLIFVNRPKRSFFQILLYDYKDVTSALYDEVLEADEKIALGRKCSEDTGKFKKLLREFTELLSTSDVGDYLPWLAWVSHVNGFKAKTKKVGKEIDEFLDGVIDAHVNHHNKQASNGCDLFTNVLLSERASSWAVSFMKGHNVWKRMVTIMVAPCEKVPLEVATIHEKLKSSAQSSYELMGLRKTFHQWFLMLS
ncbi:hypothetical protein F3Y22_tig00111772pilonHSYRG00110 [Hibiscus syriacus]|uniref:Oxidoreductase molybdopterin-binding domain-containing protein n=1 Tax=Hibiscus syriacus TaxID=106335 RepID=A0A6A2Y9B9_HIBSY|nr:hypothetical protein F3Y22_tig00111772pilonHSYRG00110 [Hibiscus syriacus]